MVLHDAEERLARWRAAVHLSSSEEAAQELVRTVRMHLANDLDTPSALAAVDGWVDTLSGDGDGDGGEVVTRAIDALLGVKL